jgi:hypothetical protein
MTKKTPPSIGQFALSERDDLLSTIAEQAREIARLNVSRVPEGWQLVPLNPAKFLDMGFAYIDAARESEPNMRWAFSHAGYKAMLSAAPAPTVEPDSDETFCDGNCTWLDHQMGCLRYEPAHSYDHSANNLTMVKVPRELLERALKRVVSFQSPDVESSLSSDLRALLAGGEA